MCCQSSKLHKAIFLLKSRVSKSYYGKLSSKIILYNLNVNSKRLTLYHAVCFFHTCRYDKISRATPREESDTDLDDGASSMVPGKKSTLA